jgi:hypothetical protein
MTEIVNSFANPQNDYSTKRQDLIPDYKYSRSYQQSGGTEVTIDTSNKESIFELPAKVMNLSKSVLKFTATPTAADFNWMFMDVIAGIRQIQLYNRSGVMLCDLNYLDKYSKIVLKTDTKKVDAIERDYGTAGQLVDMYGVVRGTSSVYQYADAAASTGTSTVDPVYVYTGVNAPILDIELPLSQLKNTILALDKDLFFNEIMLLKIIWNPYTSWGFKSNSATDPTGGVATAIAANIAITKLSFNLALENNMAISASLIQGVMSQGMSVVVPYVHPYKYTSPGSASQNVTLRFNRTFGRHLKKIYHGVFHQTETIATRYQLSNLARTKVTSYYTAVDGIRRSDFDLSVDNEDDFDYVKKQLPDSILTSKLYTFRYNWIAFERFDDGRDTATDCVDSGLPLDTEKKWDFIATTATDAHNHYTFAVCSRIFAVNSQGMMLQ